MFNPLPLLKTGLSAATGFLGGIQTYLIVGAVTAAIAGAGGAWAAHHFDEGTIKSIQLADANEKIAAVAAAAVVQKHEDAASLAHAVSEAKAQTQIEVHTVTVTKEIPTYVHDQIRCPGPTVGLARVLRAAAAAAGTDPAALQLATGQSDDDCSDVTPSEVAGWFTAYAGAAQANTEQLTQLQQWVLDDHKAQESPQ